MKRETGPTRSGEALTPESARVLVVIVNYRTAGMAIDCLRSLAAERAQLLGMRVVVTDNASGDDSVERLRGAVEEGGWSGWVTIMPLDRNGGFSYGNNSAIRPAIEAAEPPDFVWLLNPDTVVRSGGGVELLRYMLEHPQVGLAGSRLEDPDGTPQCSAFRKVTVGSELVSGLRLGLIGRLVPGWVVAMSPSDDPQRADWLAGASLLIRREVFRDAGLMDEEYFLYYEEVDYCLAAARKGWPSWYVPTSRVIHLVGQATGVSDSRLKAKRRPAYWFESRRRYFLKNWGRGQAALADLVWMLAYGLWRVRRRLQGKPDLDPPHFLRDFFRQTVFCKGFRL